MISRVAEHCFWFGRYIDRAESTARLLQTTRTLVFDADIPVTHCWQPLVIVSGAFPAFRDRFGADAAGDGEMVQDYMTWDPENLVSLHRSVCAARDSAKVIRDVLSLETWEEVNELYLWLSSDDAHRAYRENREQFYRRVRRATQLILGLVRSTMLHDRPMSFLWLGVMLERVGQTARILDMHHHTMTREAAHHIVEVALWLSLLRTCSGYEAFCKKNKGRVSARSVVSFLIFDQQFPRSLRYCARSADQILRSIWPAALEGGIGHRAATRLAELSRWLDAQQATLVPAGTHTLLTHIVDESAALCSDVTEAMFGGPHTPLPSQSQAQLPVQPKAEA